MFAGLEAATIRTMRRRVQTIDLQPWPDTGTPRVLIELADQERSLALAAAIRNAGCFVGICSGPDSTADPATRCPLHRLEPCVAVEGADVVVTALDLETEDGRLVLHGLRTRYPSTPVVVEATVMDTLALTDELEGCTVVPVGAEPERTAEAVVRSLPTTSSPVS